jgi:hypothetical protein
MMDTLGTHTLPVSARINADQIQQHQQQTRAGRNGTSDSKRIFTPYKTALFVGGTSASVIHALVLQF